MFAVSRKYRRADWIIFKCLGNIIIAWMNAKKQLGKVTLGNVLPSTIFTGDNLPILRGMQSESVDLIYLDPPFNSNRHYEAPIGSRAAGASFKDAWTLDDVDLAWHGEIAEQNYSLYKTLKRPKKCIRMAWHCTSCIWPCD